MCLICRKKMESIRAYRRILLADSSDRDANAKRGSAGSYRALLWVFDRSKDGTFMSRNSMWKIRLPITPMNIILDVIVSVVVGCIASEVELTLQRRLTIVTSSSLPQSSGNRNRGVARGVAFNERQLDCKREFFVARSLKRRESN